MLGKYLKGKFGKAEEIPPTEQFYTPLRIGLHSTITIETVDLLGLTTQFHPNFKLPNGTLDVVAISTIDNDPDKIYRISAVDNDQTPYIVQLVSSYDPRSGEQDITEAMFFQQVSNYEPLTQEEWNGVTDKLGAAAYEVDGLTYERVWGEEQDGVIELFVFEEDVVALDGETKYTLNQMLFGRELTNYDAETTEFVLMSVEEDDDRDSIITNIGFIIPPQAIRVQ